MMQRAHVRRILAVLACFTWILSAWAGPALSRQVVQKTFATPEEAFQALLSAARHKDTEEILRIFGPGSRALVHSGDPVEDSRLLEEFVKTADDRTFYHRQGAERVVVNLGFDNYPLPMPLVKKDGSWRFDTPAALQEVRNRRVGRNELSTMRTLGAIVAAQRAYYAMDPDGDGVVEYAQKITSTAGRKDGLYWEVRGTATPSPLGPEIAAAWQEGYRQAGRPYHGYYFRLLKGQGPAARGGAHGYILNGQQVAGFAVVAWPASYGDSGLTTFLVGTNGVVYEKDLGPRTSELCRAMTAYNPDSSWRKARK